jgi:hypothetical protein
MQRTTATLSKPGTMLLGVVGALLLSIPAARYRLDVTTCASWPAPSVNVALAACYLLSIGLLTSCWLGFVTTTPRLRTVLAFGVLLHALALLAPPFLSMDPLFYAATGRAMAQFHGSAYVPLDSVLAADDPLLRQLSSDWQSGSSAYFPGWNELTRLIALLSGHSLDLQLRIYQALGLGTMFATALLTAWAAEQRQPGSAGRAAALVLLCPLALIEATQAAHNDHLLALCVALFTAATVSRRPLWGVLALALGLLVKASALLLLGVVAIALIVRNLRSPAARMCVAAAVLIGAAAVLASPLFALVARFTPLFGNSPQSPVYCAHAVECLLRQLLYRAHLITAGFGLGVLFRVAGALWLLYVAFRAARRDQLLPWCGLGLFVYYTYLHAHWQAWYLLSLLPLLPFAGGRVWRAMCAACVSAVGYYAIVLPWNCASDPTLLWIENYLETAVIVAPPTAFLWWDRRR